MGVHLRTLVEAENARRSKMTPEELAEYDADTQRKLEEAVRKFQDSMPKLQQLIKPDALRALQGLSGYGDTIRRVQDSMRPTVPSLVDPATLRAIRSIGASQNFITEIGKISQQFESLTKLFRVPDIFKDLSSAFRSAQKRLWKSGWMIHKEMPLPGLREIVERDNLSQEEIDEALKEYFNERLGEIESELIEHYPHREEAIKQCFAAHRNGLYFASTPFALSLADGVFGEIVGVPQGLYGKARKTKKREAIDGLRSRLNSDPNQPALHIDSFLFILDEAGPINADKSELPQFVDPFNRHLVMHGHDTRYGTEVNSLRAISLLNFVGTFLVRYRQGESNP